MNWHVFFVFIATPIIDCAIICFIAKVLLKINNPQVFIRIWEICFLLVVALIVYFLFPWRKQ